jgi:maltose alpha-D-glucosyltransferase/alpha-amylase
MTALYRIALALLPAFCMNLAAESTDRLPTTYNQFPKPDSIQSIPSPKAPGWVNDAVFYEIYPQSFCDSDADGIGDLKGIISRLDYVKSLGVNAIWITPFFESPFRDAGYDVSDYYTVAPRYGTNDDAKELFRAAHERGLHVIIDFVAGHTSIDHPWFKASAEAKPNKYSNWYIWTDRTWFEGQEKYRGNYIKGYSDRDGNYFAGFFWHEPALNYGWGEPDPHQKWQLPTDHPDVLALREEMKKVLRYWLDMGCDGFRCDKAGILAKNDPKHKIGTFWGEVRDMMDKDYPDAFLISEWSDPTAAIDCGFHADFMHWFRGYDTLWANEASFFNKAGQGDMCTFARFFMGQYESTKGRGYISLPVGSHDLPRINKDDRDKRDIELIYVFQFTMPNIPFLYYGDEIGMRQVEGLTSKEGSYGRTGARTPMQWNSGKNFGFSDAAPEQLYLPVDPGEGAPTVEAQENDPDSLLTFVKALINLKHEHPALRSDAAFYPVYVMPGSYPYVFMRVSGGEKLLIAINPSRKLGEIAIKGKYGSRKSLIFGHGMVLESLNADSWISIAPRTFSIYKID